MDNSEIQDGVQDGRRNLKSPYYDRLLLYFHVQYIVSMVFEVRESIYDGFRVIWCYLYHLFQKSLIILWAKCTKRSEFYPSLTRVNCDKTENICTYFLYHTKDILAQFTEKKNGWWGVTPSTWNFGSTGPRLSKIADFEPIIARSASAVTPSEKSSINANRKSTTCFPMSLRWSSYVAPKSPKGVSKTQDGRFP